VRGFDGGGRAVRVRARFVVLACGAIENARLLLLSGGMDAPGNRHGWVGRCFMEHPRDASMTLRPRSAQAFHDLAFFDAHTAADGTVVGGRFALSDAVLRRDGLPNASVTLLPRLRARTGSASAARQVLERLRSLARRPATEGYGWSQIADPGEVFDGFRLILNVEQRPDPENRILPGASRDAFGLPRARLQWQWRAGEQAALERLRWMIADSLRDGGLGDVDVRTDSRPDPNAHHHAGTTRMHVDERQGVVDADGRVHGTDNLYVTGASIFPTAGFANPTLTLVALALRLADHLAGRR
jgi:choline dehydrogenase-like flavoprotein